MSASARWPQSIFASTPDKPTPPHEPMKRAAVEAMVERLIDILDQLDDNDIDMCVEDENRAHLEQCRYVSGLHFDDDEPSDGHDPNGSFLPSASGVEARL